MIRVAVSGHRGLPGETERLVDTALRDELLRLHVDSELDGISAIADGADSIFARAILDRGGKLTVIVPARKYRAALPAEHHPVYDELLARASRVISLEHVESTSESHMDAAHTMLGECDRLIAVWDGQPARGYGGTADVVAAAREGAIPVTVLWPPGATRD